MLLPTMRPFLEKIKSSLLNAKPYYFLIFFSLLIQLSGYSQTAILKGIVLDESQVPVKGATVSYDKGGTITDFNGVYQLKIPSNQDVVVIFSYVGLENVTVTVNLKDQQQYELNPILKTQFEQISTVIIRGSDRKAIQGITTLDPETIRNTPSANAGIEGLLKTLPGVSSNNELSTQYSVRGGNYDENLIYVNEIEVYRPFLVRSGQQEGLSFINQDMVQNVDFSAGGFQAKYGDKLSSVLDVTYRNPNQFGAGAEASFLGGSAYVEGTSKNNKLAAIGGIRYRNNGLFARNRETETDYNQTFVDGQAYITYDLSKKWTVGLLGNVAINTYSNQPIRRETNFGTVQEAKALIVAYQGQEEDRYDTYFGAIKTTYQANEDLTLKFIGSAYHTQEQEYFDILGQYLIGEPNTSIGSEDLGEVSFARAVGSQLNHARNDLDALIYNFQHKGTYTKDAYQIDWGIKFTAEDIRDRLQEYEVIDSAGFSIRPRIPDFLNNQPYTPFSGPIQPFTNVSSRNDVQTKRLSAFVQYSKRSVWKNAEIFYNIGLRSQSWRVEGEGIAQSSQDLLTPRAQIAIKPDWKARTLFRLSGGLYYQPPFYRELRDFNGTVNAGVQAQKSIHAVLGNDYDLKFWDRPFKLTTELYFKSIDDVNPYTLENVRIRYQARNNAIARNYGLDVRLNGEFVPGTESWFSFGYLKAEQNISDRGWIPLPTDQRLKFGVLFQDYVPRFPNLKMYSEFGL